MKLTPARAHSIHALGYKFKQDVWTEVSDADLDYLLCRWCPYLFRENFFSGPHWVRNTGTGTGKGSSFRYWERGKEKHIKLPPGEPVPLERHVAYQVLLKSGVEQPPLSDVVSPGERVLVVRNGGLGDVLLTLPALASAKEKLGVLFDYATADYLVRLPQHNPDIENVFGHHEYNGEDYAAVVDLMRTVEAAGDSPTAHRTDIFARYFGVPAASYKMTYNVIDSERDAIAGMVPDEYTAVQAGGSTPRRVLPKPKTVELLHALVAAGRTPVVVDNIADGTFDVDGAVNLTGKLSIPLMFAVLEKAECVVAGDSGVMHAAVALGTRTIGLFGAVKAELRVKEQPHCTTIQCNDWSGCPPCNDLQLRACSGDADLCLNSVPIDVILQEVTGSGIH